MLGTSGKKKPALGRLDENGIIANGVIRRPPFPHPPCVYWRACCGPRPDGAGFVRPVSRLCGAVGQALLYRLRSPNRGPVHRGAMRWA